MTAMAAALVAQWLLARAIDRAPFPPFSYGDWFIRRTPGPLATEAIEQLGPLARESIVFGGVVTLLALGAALSIARGWLVPGAVFVLTLLGAALAPATPPIGLTLAAAVVGAFAAAAILGLANTTHPVTGGSPSGRRRTLLLGGLSAGFLGLTGLMVIARVRREPPRGIASARQLTAKEAPGFAALPGLPPLITAPEDHYLVDINLQRPRIPREDWELRVNGLVASPSAFTLDDLLSFELVERAVLLQCISNWPAGPLIGNATWTCFRFTALLERVKPLPGATMVSVRAHDGYFESFPLSEAETWFVAVGMGGHELPADHGFPVRLLHPGHYGMRSVKWVSSFEFTAEDPGSYWHDRGWDREARMRIGSSIESPTGRGDRQNPVTIAGTAYGFGPVTAVELSFDDGVTWAAASAELEPPPGEYSWTRWKLTSDLAAGRHDVRARAYVGDDVQDATQRAPHPSGSSGLDLQLIDVAGDSPPQP